MSPFLETFGFASVRGYRGANGAVSSYELISSVIASAGQTTITFSSIPQTYKHLQLRVVARGANTGETDAGNSRIRFNSTTTDLAYRHMLYNNGASVASQSEASNSSMYFTPASSAPTGTYSGHIIDVLDYASTTKNKTVRALGGFSGNSSFVGLSSYFYNSTTAVSSITFINTTAFGYAVNSRFSLYGIKG